METKTERLKEQLLYFADVVNNFKSEAVQVRVIERLLSYLIKQNKNGELTAPQISEATSYIFAGNTQVQTTKPKLGHTKALKRLLGTGFFDTPRAISDIATYCNTNYEGTFQTNQFSGILLALVKETTLSRTISNETNHYEYLKLQSA